MSALSTATPEDVNRRFSKVKALIDSRPDIFLRQGVVVGSRQRIKGGVSQPYYRVAYWERRHRWIYLGPCNALAAQVRQYLDQLQKPAREKRRLDRLRTQARAELRRHKSALDAQLRPLGLRLKGYEVRGWSRLDQ